MGWDFAFFPFLSADVPRKHQAKARVTDELNRRRRELAAELQRKARELDRELAAETALGP